MVTRMKPIVGALTVLLGNKWSSINAKYGWLTDQDQFKCGSISSACFSTTEKIQWGYWQDEFWYMFADNKEYRFEEWY